jgi:phosphomannomutase
MNAESTTLGSQLDYQPVALRFGTSGRRGLVTDLSQLEVYLNALAELQYLQSLPRSEGGVTRGDEFFFACDLRPSSSQRVPGPPVRGGLAQALDQAITDAGMRPVFLGRIPTPALANYAFSLGRGSMMVTGSHIPFDRNGYKTNTATRELLKRDEGPIQAHVEKVREALYDQSARDSLFESRGATAGMLKAADRPLPVESSAAAEAYLQRYTNFFPVGCLKGLRLLAYQHSAVGRDLLVRLLEQLGAEVIPAGRSESFVPIDTEAMDEAQLGIIQSITTAAAKEHGPFDAVVSTDGDSDRPLVLGIETGEPGAPSATPKVRFFGGDLVGMVVAEYLRADAVVVPISCNDGVDRGPLKTLLQPKTRIGSPFVIEGMKQAVAQGRRAVCGWEANGGFLLGSNVTLNGRTLKALPTRDAFLPLLAVLCQAKNQGVPVSALFDKLPRRFSRAALLRNFPRSVGLSMVARLSPPDSSVRTVCFEQGVTILQNERQERVPGASLESAMVEIRQELESCFPSQSGFGRLEHLDYTDGVRMRFANGDIAHVRPSGNADELRIYAVADSQARADDIARLAVAEPAGILRQLERHLAS